MKFVRVGNWYIHFGYQQLLWRYFIRKTPWGFVVGPITAIKVK